MTHHTNIDSEENNM